MPMTCREMLQFLQQNGYIVIGSSGSHRKLYNPQTNTTVIVPYHTGDLKTGTEKAILKQAGLKKPDKKSKEEE